MVSQEQLAINTRIAMERGAAYGRNQQAAGLTYQQTQAGIQAEQAFQRARMAVGNAQAEANFYKDLVASQNTSAREQAMRENSAREATVRFWKNSKGEGVTRDPAGIDFGITFLEEPSFTQGAANSKNHADPKFGDAYGGATVRYWIRNKRGHYLGAFMTYWSRVDDESGARLQLVEAQMRQDYKAVNKFYAERAALQFELVHSLAFTGFGYKAPSPEMVNEIEVLQPRIITYN
jgi:hypothetical protein